MRSRTTTPKQAQTPSPQPGEGRVSADAVVFDVGGVLIDWNPRSLYRRLFAGDEGAMERCLNEMCSPA